MRGISSSIGEEYSSGSNVPSSHMNGEPHYAFHSWEQLMREGSIASEYGPIIQLIVGL